MRRALLVASALFAVAWCWRLDPVHRPLTGDNQLYFFMAERAASGVPPHVSHVDSKNQLGVLITAAAIAAGRVVGADDVLASRVISIAFTAVSVALVARLAVLLAGSVPAGAVAAVALLAARGFAEHTAAGNNVKIFLVTFVLLAHVAMASRSDRQAGSARFSDAAAGLAAGAAFLCWQPALLVVAAVVAEALWSTSGSMRRALLVLLFALLPVAAYECYFALHGAIGEQLHQAFVMPLGSIHRPAPLLRSLVFVATEGIRSPLVRLGPLAFALAATAAFTFALAAPARAAGELRSRRGMLSFCLAAASATAFTLYDHQGVPDLFFPDPYFAVGTALLVALAANRGREPVSLSRKRFLSPRLLATAAVAALALQMVRDGAHRRTVPYRLEDQRQAAAEVRTFHDRFGSVWAYGPVHLLGLAHLDNHVPYGLFYDDVNSVVAADTFRPLRAGLMPDVILQSRGEVPGATAYLDAQYRNITTPAFEAQSVTVWRRRGRHAM